MDYDETTEAMTAQADHATTAGAEAMKSAVNHATSLGDQAFKDTMSKSLAAMGDINEQSKRNLEALVASMNAASRGAESLSSQTMAYTKRAMEGQVEQAKALSAARSMQEVVELQTNFAKTAVESYIAELNRATQTISALVKDSFRPLNERATSMVENLQSLR